MERARVYAAPEGRWGGGGWTWVNTAAILVAVFSVTGPNRGVNASPTAYSSPTCLPGITRIDFRPYISPHAGIHRAMARPAAQSLGCSVRDVRASAMIALAANLWQRELTR